MLNLSRVEGYRLREGEGIRLRSLSLGLGAFVMTASVAACASTEASAPPAASTTARTAATASLSATLVPSPAHSPSFVVTGSLNDPRSDGMATLLQNGKVLIAGGHKLSPGGGPAATDDLTSAELYDPATGRFTSTGSMTAVRTMASATLLPDGRVLIAGGTGCVNDVCDFDGDTADLYDPNAGTFSRLGSVPKGFVVASATLLLDGKVLVLGGASGMKADLYDPASGRFAPTGDSLFDTVHGLATLTRLAGGRVFVTGIVDNDAEPPVAELYDPASGKFRSISLVSPAGPAASAQYNGAPVKRVVPETATLLGDGRVLLFENGYLETFDPATETFTPAGFMCAPGQWTFPIATLLADGRVLFEGGDFRTDPAAAADNTRAEIFDPASGPRLIGSLATPQSGQTATLLPDGTVLIAGGLTSGNSAELFRP